MVQEGRGATNRVTRGWGWLMPRWGGGVVTRARGEGVTRWGATRGGDQGGGGKGRPGVGDHRGWGGVTREGACDKRVTKGEGGKGDQGVIKAGELRVNRGVKTRGRGEGDQMGRKLARWWG